MGVHIGWAPAGAINKSEEDPPGFESEPSNGDA